uniref:Uncharacterized protein n=1 Tax=Amphimedon queenslandica TaxID=400682 RepID=A0A1X7UU83_AMPQE
MSANIRRWLVPATGSLSSINSLPFLPDTSDGDESTSSANSEVIRALAKSKRKKGEYHHYYGPTCLKIAKYASVNGNKAAVRKFFTHFGYEISEATVRNFKSKYLSHLRTTYTDAITSLPHGSSGRPLLIGKDLDDQVAVYIRKLREAGGIVNCKA